jgi:hypothetical protein
MTNPRGVCPSCNARRAHDTALHLVERVLPRAPYRQWTLSFPVKLRFCLTRDSRLLSEALGLFVRALFALQRRTARRLGVPRPHTGPVAFVQRFGRRSSSCPTSTSCLPRPVFEELGEGTTRLVPPSSPPGEVLEDDKQFETRMASFLDYYLFDRKRPENGKTPAEEILESRSSGADGAEVSTFRSFTTTVHGLFEVRKIKLGVVRLRGLFGARSSTSASDGTPLGWRRATSSRRVRSPSTRRWSSARLLLPPAGGGEGDQGGSEAPEEGHARRAPSPAHLGGGGAGTEGGPVPADRGGRASEVPDRASARLSA